MDIKIKVVEKKSTDPKLNFQEKSPISQNLPTAQKVSITNNDKKIQIEKSIYENRDKLIELFKTKK